MTLDDIQTHLYTLSRSSTILLCYSIRSELHALQLALLNRLYRSTLSPPSTLTFQIRNGMTSVQRSGALYGVPGTIPRRTRVRG
jgi:hypothetical protein